MDRGSASGHAMYYHHTTTNHAQPEELVLLQQSDGGAWDDDDVDGNIYTFRCSDGSGSDSSSSEASKSRYARRGHQGTVYSVVVVYTRAL